MSQLVPYEGGQVSALTDGDVVDFVRQAFDDVGIDQSNLTKIKIPTGGGSAFEVPTLGGSEFQRSIDAVIVFARPNQRAWYRVSYEESGGGSAPDCSSTDGVVGTGCRDLEVDEEGGEAQDYSCADCPWNQWESKRLAGGRTGKGKDCAELTYLYFFSGDQLLPQMMIVPPTSVAEFKRYAVNLMKYGRKPQSVVTRISLIQDESSSGITYSKLHFDVAGSVPEDDQQKVTDLGAVVRHKFADFNPLDQD